MLAPLALGIVLQQEVNVTVNHQPVPKGVVMNGRTLVPVRGVLEHLGIKVSWLAQYHQVVAESDNNTVLLWPGRNTAKIDGKDTPLDVPPTIINGTTYVPLRFISEAVGAAVSYDGKANLVDVEQAATTPIARQSASRDIVASAPSVPWSGHVWVNGQNFLARLSGQTSGTPALVIGGRDYPLYQTKEGSFTNQGVLAPDTAVPVGAQAGLKVDGVALPVQLPIESDPSQLVPSSTDDAPIWQDQPLTYAVVPPDGPALDPSSVQASVDGRPANTNLSGNAISIPTAPELIM